MGIVVTSVVQQVDYSIMNVLAVLFPCVCLFVCYSIGRDRSLESSYNL